MFLDPNQSKSNLMGQILEMAPDLSPSKAGRIAAKIQRGDYSPEMARVIGWADPTGEAATGFRQQPIGQLWTDAA